MSESVFNKLAGLKPAILLRKRLWTCANAELESEMGTSKYENVNQPDKQLPQLLHIYIRYIISCLKLLVG